MTRTDLVPNPEKMVEALRRAGHDKATVPPVTGSPWTRYRLYDAAHGIPFQAFPTYRDGGPTLVTYSGPNAWHVSYATEDDPLRPVRLKVFRFDMSVRPWRTERHPLDGTVHRTMTDARRAAYEAGLLAFMVYEARP